MKAVKPRSYRVGNLRIERAPNGGVEKHLNSPVARRLGRKQLGFEALDVTLSLRKPFRIFGRPKRPMYKAKYDVRAVRDGGQAIQVGFGPNGPIITIDQIVHEVPNPTKAEIRYLEKHALVHGIHTKLHDEHNIAFIPGSTLFDFSHEFFRMFQERKTWNDAGKIPFEGRNPFRDARRIVETNMQNTDWLGMLKYACATRFPTRRALMDAITRMYEEPSLRMPMLRLGHQMQVTEDTYNQTIRDFVTIIDFFERQSRIPVQHRRTRSA